MKKIYSSKKMKLFCLVLLLTGYSFIAKSQVVNYGFSQSVGTYTPISGGTSLGNTSTDDERFVDPAFPLGGTTTTGVGFPIGFNFTYNGNIFDRVAINANGWISLGKSASTPSVNLNSTSSYTPLSSAVALTPVELRSRISAMGRDIEAQAGADIRLETIGSAPNRTCVVQWTAYKKWNQTGDNLNFQIRLNETTNTVDIVYGTIAFNATSNTADVGLAGSVATDFNDRTTTTDWNATTLGPLNTSRCTMLNTVTVPVSGRTFTWTPPVPCTGTPTPGNTVSTANPTCSGVSFTLSLQNNPAVTGLTYQWQSSPDGTTWTNIATATNSTYTTSQTVATWYQCLVTCSGNTATSTSVQVTMSSPTDCYCTPPTTNCNLDDVILNVTAIGINNTTTCSTNGFSNYTTSVAAGSVAAGVTFPMSVRVGPGGTEYVGVWIDYNKNGNFEASEFTALGSGNGVTISGTVTVPGTATVGLTRMRVRVRYNTPLTGADACLGYTFGETEDYAVNITPCIPGTISTQPASGSVACGGFKTFSVTAAGTALTYQWQERASATAPWTIVNNGGIYSGATTATLTLTGVSAASNGHQFQVAVGGACTPLFLSSVATLTVTPYQAPISPVPAIFCAGSSLQIFASPPPAVTTVCSGTLNLHITDGAIAGVNNTLNVSGIPAGAVISKVEVKLNVVHPYVSDLEVVVKGPNGQVLNLSNLIGGTNDPYEDFTNTVFTSDPAAPALVTGTSPGFTGTFKPDRAGAVGAFGVPGGPTGFLPTFPANTGSLLDLATNPNGAWTIAMYDAGPPDEGDLINWCVSITWGVAPATGVFSPVTNLWLDAGLTVPYTGTAVNSVYTNAPASTVYTAVVSNGICTATVDIPVTVATPLTNLVNPANKSVCIGGTTSFTATATGGPFSYAWEVSTDGGATWAPVSNGGVYSGATTGTITLSNVPDTYEGYQYRATLNVATCATSATSGAATLTVNPLPVVVINAAPYTKLYPGLTTTITAAVSPNAASTYQWYKNGVLIPGATASTIVVDVDNLGDYSVTVDDVNGCNSSSSSLTISDAANDILFIYPSPNTGQFQVRYYNTPGNNVNVRTLTIFDSKGSRVYTKTYDISLPYTKMDVDMSNYSKGIYHVELGDRNGKRIKTGSVLIR